MWTDGRAIGFLRGTEGVKPCQTRELRGASTLGRPPSNRGAGGGDGLTRRGGAALRARADRAPLTLAEAPAVARGIPQWLAVSRGGSRYLAVPL